MKYENEADILNKTIFDLINELFKKERENSNPYYRNNFFNENRENFVLTDDGSYSVKSREINSKVETLHTISGAISESFEKFINPLEFQDKSRISILDICAGLGYNSSAAICEFREKELKIDMVEISKPTLACGILVPSPIPEHDITKKAIEDELIRQGYASLSLQYDNIPENIDINVFIEDARKTIQNLDSNSYDAIFLDPFSQNMSPELFSLDFFKQFKRVIRDDGVICTYTSSAPVRAGFVEADFHVGMGPIFGRKQGGTLASLSIDNLYESLPKNDEIRIALSDVGVPFRDVDLDDSSENILKRRALKRKKSRHNTKISSAVKTPIFLTKDMDDEKLKRRVERNLSKMNISSTTSKEAFFILEPESNYEKNQTYYNNSRKRILEMIENLDIVKNNNFYLD